MVPEKIKELANKFLNGTASEEEKAILHQWYDNWTDQEQVILADTEEPGIIENRILSHLQEQIREESQAARVVTMRKRNRWKIAAAASVILLLGAATFLWQYRQTARPVLSNTDDRYAATTIKPGIDQAKLILPNGRQIILDSTVSGIISKQDNTNIINLGGQLAYKDAGDHKQQHTTVDHNTITTGRGNQYQLILPDGSHIWLNAASSLIFPTAFQGNERVVELTGEAYFEIAKDKSRPFRVLVPPHTGEQGGAAIEVLGTHFNVNAYGDESAIRTTLLEGKVKVGNRQLATGNEQQRSVILKPGQQAVISSSTEGGREGAIAVQTADIEEAVAWKNGYFQYTDAPLATVMRQVSRWYDVEVVYTGNIQDEVFSGTIPRAANIAQLLKILELTKTVKFRIEGKKLIAASY